MLVGDTMVTRGSIVKDRMYSTVVRGKQARGTAAGSLGYWAATVHYLRGLVLYVKLVRSV